MMENYSLSDLSALMKDKDNGFGGDSLILILLFLLIFSGGGAFGGNRNSGELNQYATAASQQQILFNQQFDNLGRQINAVGDGISSLGYSLAGSITSEGRAIQSQLAECCCTNQRNVDSLRFDMSNYNAATVNAIHAEAEKTREMLNQNKIEALQAEVNNLKMQSMMCGVIRYPNSMSYSAGGWPFCSSTTGTTTTTTA